MKIDVIKVLLDHESENDLDQALLDGKTKGLKRDYLRYSVINSTLLLLATVSKNCESMKPYIGK